MASPPTPGPRALALLAAGALIALGAAAPDDAPPPADQPVQLESRPRGAVPRPPALATSPPAIVQLGSFTSVQVNVDDNGNNIVGDAGNEPSLAVDPTAPNRIAAGWRQFDTITNSFRQAGWSYSVDGGRTWAGKQVIEPGIFRSDPVLSAANDGTFYYLSLTITAQNEFLCDMYESSDAGQTWPVKRFAFGGDKAWIAVDNTGGIGDGNIYQGWNIAGNEFFPNLFNRFLDTFQVWEDPVEYDPDGEPPAQPVFGQVAVGPTSAVYVAGAQNSSNTDVFWVVVSTDAWNPLGDPTFSRIVQVDLGGNLRIGTGPNPAGLLGQVNISIDQTSGVAYVLGSVDPSGSDPMDIKLIRSMDGAANWSSPVRINDDSPGTNAWQWFGTMSVAPNGRIDVVWNDTRNSGQTNISELFYSFSTDGGLTWSANQQVSPSFDSFVGWPSQNKLGDYYDMISDDVGAHLIWAATFNGEQDVYYLRIGDYDCNGNGIGDAEDLLGGTSGDCNENDIPDECEIAAGVLEDANGNGVPDICEGDCTADFDGNGEVDIVDLLDLLAAWGTGDPLYDIAPLPAGDGTVDIQDLLELLAQWGPC
jgi:hypothetical protein